LDAPHPRWGQRIVSFAHFSHEFQSKFATNLHRGKEKGKMKKEKG